MFDHIPPERYTNTDRFAPLREFVEPHRGVLLNAAALLGGSRGVCLATDAFDGLASEVVPSRRTAGRLFALLEILALENVHDEICEEAARFAAIDPADPVVEEICVLTDGLRNALEAAFPEGCAASRSLAA